MKVILLVVDSLRADHSRFTPNIRKLAEGGVEYLNARSMGSNTVASLPYILSEYLTAYLTSKGSSFNLVIHANVNVRVWAEKAGYDQIDLYKNDKTKKLVDVLLGRFKSERRAEMVNRVARLVNTYPRPRFVCLWYMDVHAPYMPPGDGVRTYLFNKRLRKAKLTGDYTKITRADMFHAKVLYQEEIIYFDYRLGEFLKTLRGDELVVLTSDHGEEFLEDGELGHPDKDIDVLRHVPLIFYGPGIKPGVVEEEFSFRKFDKTLIEYMGEG